jgi:hypothetical protein
VRLVSPITPEVQELEAFCYAFARDKSHIARAIHAKRRLSICKNVLCI